MHPVIAWWIDTVLGTWEETLKALVREVCTQLVTKRCLGQHSTSEQRKCCSGMMTSVSKSRLRY